MARDVEAQIKDPLLPPRFLKFRSSNGFILSTVCVAIFTDAFLYGVVCDRDVLVILEMERLPILGLEHRRLQGLQRSAITPLDNYLRLNHTRSYQYCRSVSETDLEFQRQRVIDILSAS